MTMRCGSTSVTTITAAATVVRVWTRRERILRRERPPLPARVYFLGRRGGAEREHGRLDVGQPHRSIRLRGEDLCRENPQSAAKDVRRRERSQCVHEHEQRRSGDRRHQQWQRHAPQSPPRIGAQSRRGLVERCIEALQPGGNEQKDVDVHRVRVDEDDRADPLEPPRSLPHSEDALNRARDEAALAVQEEKCDYPDQRRQRGGKRGDRAKEPAPGKIEASEQERERDPDRQ